MSKYIDADKLKAEIERLRSEAEYEKYEAFGNHDSFIINEAKEYICMLLKSFIDSLQQEQTEADLEVSKFCQPVPENIANCVAEHFWEMLDDEEKEDTRTIETAQQEQEVADLEKEIDRVFFQQDCGSNRLYYNEIANIARHFAEWGAIHLNTRKEE